MTPECQITKPTLIEHRRRGSRYQARYNRPYVAERDALAAPDDPRRVIATMRALAQMVSMEQLPSGSLTDAPFCS